MTVINEPFIVDSRRHFLLISFPSFLTLSPPLFRAGFGLLLGSRPGRRPRFFQRRRAGDLEFFVASFTGELEENKRKRVGNMFLLCLTVTEHHKGHRPLPSIESPFTFSVCFGSLRSRVTLALMTTFQLLAENRSSSQPLRLGAMKKCPTGVFNFLSSDL